MFGGRGRHTWSEWYTKGMVYDWVKTGLQYLPNFLEIFPTSFWELGL
jgi:hypothetical protein